jgi:hypothetical protein
VTSFDQRTAGQQTSRSLSALVRAGGWGGVAGGFLRTTASFAPAAIQSTPARESLYWLVDVCLIMGLVSLYVSARRVLGPAGIIGLFMAAAGILIVRLSSLLPYADLYSAGALCTAVGVLTVSLAGSRKGLIARWVPALIALSIVAGIAGTLAGGSASWFIASGVMFGVGFAGMSRATGSAPAATPTRAAHGLPSS